MSKNQPLTVTPKSVSLVRTAHGFSEYRLDNGLTVLHHQLSGTGVVTSNIVYRVGSIDEVAGETGLAHMLEHMLFKPTKQDFKRGYNESSAMKFEREVGVLLNASTWRDRTNYYFSYGHKHLARALKVEAERMRGTTLEDKEFLPERNNVLSEFDMYNGRPDFALSVALHAAAFTSHPYGHETIGYRPDIEAYTTEKLKHFYDQFYRPDNATMIICGDVDAATALTTVAKYFTPLKNPPLPPKHRRVVEPKQEGIRRVEIKRPGTLNLLAIGFKHRPFPEADWYATQALLELLAGGPDSLLYTKLVDTGLVSSIDYSLEPTKEPNLASLYLTLSDKMTHEKLERLIRQLVGELTVTEIEKKLPTLVAKSLTALAKERDSSLSLATELTEYIASGDWTAFFTSSQKLKRLTAKQVAKLNTEAFVEQNLTVAYYRSHA